MLALSYFEAKASACTACCIQSSPSGPTGPSTLQTQCCPHSITFALQGGGSSLGDSPSLTLAVEEAPSPPAFWTSPSVTLMSAAALGSSAPPRGFLLNLLCAVLRWQPGTVIRF